jgi:hypothetical protein
MTFGRSAVILRRGFVLTVAILSALAAPPLGAQQERIPLTLSPRPDQVIHTTSTQQAEMQIEGANVSIQSTTKVVMTHKVGTPTPEGALDVLLTFDEFVAQALMNGQPAPLPIPTLTGHAFTITFDAGHTVTAVKASDAGDEAVVAVVRAMIEQMYQQSDRTIAVGETVTLPVNRMLAMGGLGGGAQTNGQLTMTLTAIDREGGERIARFTQKIDASTAPDPTGPAISTKMSGSGTANWNLDRGYITAGDMTLTLDGDMMQARLHGTMTVKTTGSN